MTPKQLDKAEMHINKNKNCYYSGSHSCTKNSTLYYCKDNNYENGTYILYFCYYHYKNYKRFAIMSKVSEQDLFYLRITGKI